MRTFATFEELENFLREWRSFSDDAIYDTGGAIALLGACLDNLRARLLDAELEEEFELRLTDAQREYLKKIAATLT